GRSPLAIGVPQGLGDGAAGGGQCAEPSIGEHPGAHGVPDVRQHQRPLAMMGRAEPPGRRGQRAHSSYVPGAQVRVLTPTVFHALIATSRLTSAATSSGWYSAATSAYASAGTGVWASCVTDWVQASAARSRAVKTGVSRQAGSA